MTAPRVPLRINQLHSSDIKNMFEAYRPDFWQNIQLGYVRESEVFTMGSKVVALADTDGQVNAKYKGAVTPNTGPIPREYDFYGNIGLPATDTVRAQSTSANDVAPIRIRGCDSTGIETEEYMYLDGTNVVESQTLWLTVHWIEYLPYLKPYGQKQKYNEGEIVFSDPELDVYPSMVMEEKSCRASNSIYRCPKYMKAFIVDQWFDVESGCSQGIFIQDENRYRPSLEETRNEGWHQLYEGPVSTGGVSNQVLARRSIDDGDYWSLTVRNPADSPINCYWQQRIVQCVIDYAPSDYKMVTVLPVGVNSLEDLGP